MTDTSIPPDSPEEDEVWCASCGSNTHRTIDHNAFMASLPVTDLFLGTVGDATVEFGPAEEITDLPPEDITTDLPAEEYVKVGDGSCSVCGAPTFRPPGLTKAGHKKRTPKYCDLHNPKLRVSSEGPFTQGMEGVAQLQKIQGELADDLRLLAVMAGSLLPVTGVYVWENADPFTEALLKLCKNNPRALRVLHRAATVAPIYEVAKDLAGLAYAIQVDLNKMEPHTMVGQRLGVSKAYDTVYTESTNGTPTNVATNGTQGPPRYAAA